MVDNVGWLSAASSFFLVFLKIHVSHGMEDYKSLV